MPSDPVFLKAYKALATKIAADYSSGYSGLYMTATGRVIRGIIPEAPILPFASIFFVETSESAGPVLTRYSGTMTFEIYAFAGGDTITERADAAVRLGADMMNAINTDRSLGLAGAIDDVVCNFTHLEGDRIGVPHAGVAFVQALVTFQSDRGV